MNVRAWHSLPGSPVSAPLDTDKGRTGGEPRELLEFEGNVRMGLDGFCWSSDSRGMIFLKRIKTSEREQPNQFRNELWVLAADAGEPRKLGDLPNGAGGISLHPNGRSLVFGSNVSRSEVWVMENLLPGEGEK
jgi:hypothetical protein